MTSTSTSGILPIVSSSNAFPIWRLQPHMGKLLSNDLLGNVLWEETDLPSTTSSLMDLIIPKSSIHRSVIEEITYTTGVPILADRKWQLNKHQNKQKQQQMQAPDDTDSDAEELETDCDGSSASAASDTSEGSSSSATADTSDQSWGSQGYNPDNPNRKLTLKWTPEQKWARLFNTLYLAMHMAYKVMFPHRSPTYPFKPADLKCPHWQWSPEFCNVPILDATNIQKPDIVLLDRNVQLKGWGAHPHIPWHTIVQRLAANCLCAHYMARSGLAITCLILITANPTHLVDMLNTMSLGNSKVYGMDPTMHMCNDSCKNMQCEVGDQVIGWIEDKQRQKLLIIAILWRSQGLFSHGTICYHIQDKDGVEYALKDCWVDEAKKYHEEKIIEIVWGIPNVVTLVAAWDVKYEGESDSTLRIHNCHSKFSPGFCSHKAMIRRNILHRDLSPNNIIIHEGHGFFIDFDHTQIITQGSTSKGTIPYMSIHLLYAITAIARDKGLGNMMVEQTASDDLESLFYIFIEFITSFYGLKGSRTDLKKADRWGEVIEGMGAAAAPYKLGLVLMPRHDNELINCTTTYFGGVRDLVQA
ncbi:uncharacterized protein F5147DRAFT_658061 [Suillus discolor]|uniref:Fungal-type protein kinase domain-containing protein n=1 Tax=Suillus discolor TaxID=1912936 RepID=A0A9P7JML9_9AGAM|nr:uncharacterized protein F5147DRAFT_658061 [Suillus discolor]KAG2090920.1 hypothetical protein F5147DRAFT_658061 [Suillus discolor]